MLNKNSTITRSLVLTILTTALISPGAWGRTFKILHTFGNGGDGRAPSAGQIFDAQGNLYGVTNVGPPGNGCNGEGCGTVYQLKPNSDGSWTETIIHAFDGNDVPLSSPIFDRQGNIDGSTVCGDQSCDDAGFVYQLMPNSNGTWMESVLHQFSAPWEGSSPGELTLDTSGNIYGTTSGGGLLDAGVVFSLNRSLGWQERLLHTFNQYAGDGGESPFGAITFDANGNLYGTTVVAGAYNCGVVFKLTKQGSVFWQETVLYAFTCAPDGNAPVGVVFGPDGSLYGVTPAGGNVGGGNCAIGCGTVFKLAPNFDGTWTETVLYAFSGGLHDGETPTQRVTFDQAGNIYGTTAFGGLSSSCTVFGCGGPCSYAGCGTVFKLTPSPGGQWTESILHFFSGGSDGFNPHSPVAIDGAGNLYGTAGDGGMYGGGVAYEITP
jgi:uncharacterized repeat protein (TIGR03803 family)